MRYQDDINTEHNMMSVCHAAVARWTKRLNASSKLEKYKYSFITLHKSIIENTLSVFAIWMKYLLYEELNYRNCLSVQLFWVTGQIPPILLQILK